MYEEYYIFGGSDVHFSILDIFLICQNKCVSIIAIFSYDRRVYGKAVMPIFIL